MTPPSPTQETMAPLTEAERRCLATPVSFVENVNLAHNTSMFLTYRYRVKDGSNSTRRALRKQARAVNYVWNYLCQIDREAARRWKAGMQVRRPTRYDLDKLCRGTTKELGIHSDTIGALCKIFVQARQACFPKTPRFRSVRKNLDWVPVSHFTRNASLSGARLKFLGRAYFLWCQRPLGENPREFELCCDARGRWYVNIVCKVPEGQTCGRGVVGLDLGLATLVTGSDGSRIEHPRLVRMYEGDLAKAQRAGNKARTRAIHAKVANTRRHFLHHEANKLVDANRFIAVGDVSASKLKQTTMAKSVSDASWATLKHMLAYKSRLRGAVYVEVNEAYTSRTCSCCGTIPDSSPKGMGALRIRQWSCSSCGAVHDRDINAAKNILRAGLECQPLAGEISAAA